MYENEFFVGFLLVSAVEELEDEVYSSLETPEPAPAHSEAALCFFVVRGCLKVHDLSFRELVMERHPASNEFFCFLG